MSSSSMRANARGLAVIITSESLPLFSSIKDSRPHQTPKFLTGSRISFQKCYFSSKAIIWLTERIPDLNVRARSSCTRLTLRYLPPKLSTIHPLRMLFPLTRPRNKMKVHDTQTSRDIKSNRSQALDNLFLFSHVDNKAHSAKHDAKGNSRSLSGTGVLAVSGSRSRLGGC